MACVFYEDENEIRNKYLENADGMFGSRLCSMLSDLSCRQDVNMLCGRDVSRLWDRFSSVMFGNAVPMSFGRALIWQ